MTDDQTRERAQELERLGRLWPAGWTRAMAAEYQLALNDLTARELRWAISRAAKDRTTRPMPAQLRDILASAKLEHEAARAADDHDQERRARGEGQGCPTCRHEGTTQTNRTSWVNGGSDTLAHCPTHNTCWRGQLPERHDQADEPIDPDVWRANALAGAYGATVRRIAEAGATPATAARALATAPSDDEMRDRRRLAHDLRQLGADDEGAA